MIDGHSLNYPVWGGAAWAYDTMSLHQVEHVEIIRGPGSALYGANAFSGIINVVTKKGFDVAGTELSVGGGSNGAKRINLLHGKQYGGLDLLAFVDYFEKDSDDLFVSSDAIGLSGVTNDWAESWDVGLKLGWNDFVLNTRMMKRDNGPYIGVQYVLNDESRLETEQYLADLSYSKEINDQWMVNAKAYLDYLDMVLNWEIYPEGVPFAILGLGPLGWGPNDSTLGAPSMKNRRLGVEVGSSYNISDVNTLTVGALYEKVKHYDLGFHSNYHPLTFAFLGSVQDTFSLGEWGVPAEREILAAYIQDEWEIINDVRLTAGIRYDHYSDFGSITNPRVGLVWSVSPKVDLKFLYGEAFRIPNFEELYLKNNPATKGNENLTPEEMQTYEAAINYRPTKGAELTVSGFHNTFTDRIDLIPIGGGLSEFQNAGDATIVGIESEFRYKLKKYYELYANHTWQNPEDDKTGQRIADVPSIRWNLGVNLLRWKNLNGNFNIRYVGDRPRINSDPRSSLDSYTVADLSLNIMDVFTENLELRGSLFNIFDEKYAYSAPLQADGTFTLEDDYPAPGRTFFLELRYSFYGEL